jgi:hypothetical protein
MRLTAIAALLGFVTALAGVPSQGDKKTDKSKPRKKRAAIKIEVVVPKVPVPLADIQDGNTGITLCFKNEGKQPAVLWPFVGLRVLDAKGKEAAQNMQLGRFGLTLKDCFLEEIPFWTVKPGAVKEIKVGLAPYIHDPRIIHGWDLAAGKYQLVFTYQYDRKAFKAQCQHGCKHHDNPERPWNKAIEMKQTVKANLTVKE